MDSSTFSSQMQKKMSIEVGCDFHSEMDAEGGRLWDTLNDLSMNPTAYQEFILRQNQRQQSSSLEIPPFVPCSGFVVKSFLSNRTKLFVNICHHDIVSKPFHGSGIPVEDSCKNTDGLQIPLLVSKMRRLDDGGNDEALVVDVVVHSWCMEACINPSLYDERQKSSSFKMQLIDLALQSIENDHYLNDVKHDTKWKAAYTISKKRKYKGGVGPDGSKPLPFEPHERVSNKTKLDAPEDLLRHREMEESTSKSKEFSLKMPGQSRVGETLVQQINENIVSKSSGLRSGFLTASTKPLYTKDKSTGDRTQGVRVRNKLVHENSGDGNETCLAKAAEFTCVDNGDSRSDFFPAHSSSLRDNPRKPNGENVSLFNTDNELTVQIELSSCRPPIQTMNDLILHVSSNSLVLEATKCQKQWKLLFPSPVDDTSVSAKLRAKTQTLVIKCLKRDIV